MKYGGDSRILDTRCPLCEESPDRHRPFKVIESSAPVMRLLDRLYQALNGTAVDAYFKGLSPDDARTQSMMGGAITTIGTTVVEFVALSGVAGNDLFNHIDMGVLGPNVVCVQRGFGSILPTNPICSNATFTPVLTDTSGYPIGSCAAPQLLTAVYARMRKMGAPLASISMAEVLWYTGLYNTKKGPYSTSDPAPPCVTCQQVLPQMLCDKY